LKNEWNKAQKKKVAEQSVAADYLNRTIPNLSSIVFLAEEKNQKGKSTRMLLTGDAGGDLILKGLEAAKLLDKKGGISVDVLKVQHHGSKHSIEPSFFEKVQAKSYVISGNGAHGIPNIEVLEWLSQARKDKPFDVYMTNRQLQESGKDYTPKLDKFLQQEKRKQPQHKYHFRGNKELSITVE
jgi:beta-lactamase superfamily II metal-dependent hydrolase